MSTSDWQQISVADDAPGSQRLAAWSLGSGPTVAFVHGFTQSSISMRDIAGRIADLGNRAVVVDLPAHGGSGAVRADLLASAAALSRTVGDAVYVGYSLGGRVCLHAALAFPGVVNRLALIGATPGIVDERERADRIASDDRLADRILAIGTESFLDEWTARPLFAGLTLTPADRVDRCRNSPDALAASLRLAGTGTQESLWSRLPELSMPVLAMVGDGDDKFLGIARAMNDQLQFGRVIVIDDAGHAAHLQNPERVSEEIGAWLLDTTPDRFNR